MAKIFGYCPANRQTDKAVRITVQAIDGETVVADTVWLPRSICLDLEIRNAEDGVEVRADVPAWWVAKLDTRPTWQKQGMARPPMAQRPW